MKSYSFYVENLKCGGCANTIKKTLSKFSSVQSVDVNAEQSRIDLELDYTEDQISLIKQKLATIGYPEKGDDNTIFTEAKSYVSCAIGRIGVQ
jgi:copper chaperone CopZ